VSRFIIKDPSRLSISSEAHRTSQSNDNEPADRDFQYRNTAQYSENILLKKEVTGQQKKTREKKIMVPKLIKN